MLQKKCALCGKGFNKPYHCSKKSWKIVKYCSKSCRAKGNGINNRGIHNGNYKGGCISANGYKVLHINGKRITEHRYVMEQYLGRKLSRFEIVHHIDGNKLNNSLKNLFLFSCTGDHSKLHCPNGSKFGINARSN